MKRLFIVFSLFLLLTSCFTSNNDFKKGTTQLENMGYTDVVKTGYKMWCCGEDDRFATGFKALDKNGKKTTGCFCSSLFKGMTIRFE